MKYILPILILFSAALQAQDYKAQHASGKLILEGVDNAHITAYDGNEIVISADVDRDSDEMERAKGLKVVNSLGLDDNTELGLSAVKDGEDFRVIGIGSGSCSCDGEYEFLIPRSMGIDYSHSTYDSDDLIIEGVSEEIIVSTNYSDIELINVTGPMSIKTVYGDIEAKFEQLNQNGSVSLNSVYGLVDIGLPASTKADVSLRTPYGQILTDMDIEVEKTDGMRELSSKRIAGTLNGGGVDLILKSGYENIYLRKN